MFLSKQNLGQTVTLKLPTLPFKQEESDHSYHFSVKGRSRERKDLQEEKVVFVAVRNSIPQILWVYLCGTLDCVHYVNEANSHGSFHQRTIS